MSRSTYFVQECPTCGRNLQVRVEYLGKQVACQHCRARFEACEPGSAAYPPSTSSLSLLERAEQLLQTTAASRIGGVPAMRGDEGRCDDTARAAEVAIGAIGVSRSLDLRRGLVPRDPAKGVGAQLGYTA